MDGPSPWVDALYDAALRDSPAPSIVTTLAGEFVRANPAMCALLGADEAAIVAGGADGVLHPASRAEVLGGYRRLVRDGQGFRMVHRLVAADGSELWVDGAASLLHGPVPGEPSYVLLQYTDLTAARRAEAVLRRRVAQQAAIATLGREALAASSVPEVLERVLGLVCETLDVGYGAILQHVQGDEMLARALVGWPAAPDEAPVLVVGLDSLAGRAFASGRAVCVGDLTAPRAETQVIDQISLFGMRSGMSAPVPGRPGPWGVLVVHDTVTRSFDDDDTHFLESAANVVSSAIERDRFEAEVRHHLLHDPLTGLPGRALFTELLSAAVAVGAPVTVVAVSVDRFGLVNESLGHEAGDQALAGIAQRLRDLTHVGDVVGRLGGDEFAIACRHGQAEALALGARVVAVMASPLPVDGRDVRVTVSVGAATATDADEALRGAHAAVVRAKERGGGRMEALDPAGRHSLYDRLEAESGLAQAIERDELRVHFQPVVSLVDGAVHGFEALLRWDRPGQGIFPPSTWIGIAEDTGLIVEIGAWVLGEAARVLAGWRAMPGWGDLTVAVNISPRQLAHPWFVRQVGYALEQARLPAPALVLEITERSLMHDPERMAEVLSSLRAGGVGVAIDDFGTGYSSLSYLTRLPVDVLKVDRSFVAGLLTSGSGATVARLIVDLARSLGLGVVAEGVESPAQAAALVRLGCELAQGYLMARPIPADEVPAVLARPAFWWLAGEAHTPGA